MAVAGTGLNGHFVCSMPRVRCHRVELTRHYKVSEGFPEARYTERVAKLAERARHVYRHFDSTFGPCQPPASQSLSLGA